MKSLSLLILLAFGVSVLAQQKPIPTFGKVEKADLELKECDFDKQAEALVLFDMCEVFCNFNPNSLGDPISTLLERHVRIKILSDKGLDRADIHIPYYSYKGLERLKNLNAQTYNLDPSGNVVTSKVEKKLVYNKKLNSRYSEDAFTFPEVKAGSIIEYKYVVDASTLSLPDWYFQRSIPVKLSQFTLNFPPEFEVLAQPYCSLDYSRKEMQKGNRDIKVFSMEKVPALRDEAFISCEDDYLQKIRTSISAYNSPLRRISLIRFWPSVIKELIEDEDFGIQLKREIPRTADLDAQLKPVTDPYQRMKIIHSYVRKNMEWNGYDGIWALDGVKSAWKEKKGTTGEINLILVNLLKDAGLKAHPVLVSTRENGMVQTGMANVGQFDKVMAYVTINDRVFVLDATDKYTPPHLIPLDVVTNEGLVIEKIDTWEWGWKTLWDDSKSSRNIIVLQGTIDEKGTMKGAAVVTNQDYGRVVKMPKLKTEKQKYIDEVFGSGNPALKIDSFTLENQEHDSLPLVNKLYFTQQLAASGDYQHFTINMFTGLEKNPFIPEQRFSDIFFGTNQQINVVANFTIPANYVFEETPKNIKMIMPDTSIVFARQIATQGNQVNARLTIEFKRPFYSVEQYPEFHEFYKQLFTFLNDQIVIKKKAQP
jgi:Domain of Unknown Function with PDB structure (DUF3857)